MLLNEFIVASDGCMESTTRRTGMEKRKNRSYIPACFSSAKIASFAFKPYFSRSFSPFLTCISSMGFPMQKSEYAGLAMILFYFVNVEMDDG